MKRPAINHALVEMIKERIEINEQTRRWGEIMDLAHRAARGEQLMSEAQADAAKIFMVGFKTVIGRFVPELKAIEHSGEVTTRRVDELSDEQLADIATGSSVRAAPAPQSTH
jgi:hypothetical protein